jgi:DNA-binding NarL/FixJ family response regulator
MTVKPVYCRRFVDRTEQLDLLLARASAASKGEGSLVLVSGDAGSGKTRLITEFSTRARTLGVRVSVGNCYDYVRSPFAPFVSTLRALHSEDPSIIASSEDAAATLAGLAPELAGRAAPPQADELRQFDALTELFRRFAAAKASVIVLGDLQWADDASLRFLQHLARLVASSQLLVVGTYRGDEMTRGHPLRHVLGRLARLPYVWQIRLEPLNDADMQLLIFHALEGHAPLSATTVDVIRSRSEGNPLFAEELLKSALDSRDAKRLQLPPTLREAMLERLVHFDESERSTLACAAAIGREFGPEFLAKTVDQSLERVTPVLRKALDLQLIVEEKNGEVRYGFRHSLIRDAVYDELLAAEARPLHKRIATALEAEGPADDRIAELAYHWWQARDAEKSAETNERAGDRAFSLYAYHDSVVSYERALESGALEGAHRAAVYRKLARSLKRCGFGDRARAALESALEYYESVSDGQGIANASLSLARLCDTLSDFAGHLRMTERALRVAEDLASQHALFSAHVEMARHFIAYRWSGEKALEHLARAAEFKETATPRALFRFYEYRSVVYAQLGRSGDALDNALQAALVAEQAADFQGMLRCWANFAISMAQTGERRLAVEAFERALETTRAKGLRGLTASWCVVEYAHACLLHGELERGRALIELALSANIEMASFRLRLAAASVLLGSLLQDEELIRRGAHEDLVDFALRSSAVNAISCVAFFAENEIALDRADVARGMLHQAIESLHALDVSPAPGDADVLFLAIAKHGDLADVPRAREFLRKAAELTAVRSLPACIALFEAFVSTRMHKTGAQVEALEAVELFRELRWPYYEAQALELAGSLGEALAVYRHIGDVRDTRRLEAVLSPVNRRGRAPNALTSREQEISKLIAAGKSNRAVAEALVISERTVESHVSSILSKLQLGSRGELVVRMKSDGTSM